MAIQRHDISFPSLDAEDLAAWRDVPPAIVSDCMNRGQAMAARIKPLAAGMRLTGQARTVAVMVGDNGALHRAIGLARPGEILVVDAHAHVDTAIWGGIMTRAAVARGLGGLVIDGAVRDSAEIRELGFPCFASAVVPAGPHKGFGGVLDAPLSCGGCAVQPGDIIVGDDDGVAVVPLAGSAPLLKAARAKMAQEREILAAIERGELPADLMGIAIPDLIEGSGSD